MEVAVSVRSRVGGPVLLTRTSSVQALCAQSRYFKALLCGSFRESIDSADDVDSRADVDIVLPLPETAPKGLDHVLDHIAGTASAPLSLDTVLLYRRTFEYLGADDCLAACEYAWRHAIDAWYMAGRPCCCSTASQAMTLETTTTESAMTQDRIDPTLVLAAYACALGQASNASAEVYNPARPLFDRMRLWALGDAQARRSCQDHSHEYMCQQCTDASHEWIAHRTSLYAQYGGALLDAHDCALQRMSHYNVSDESNHAQCLDVFLCRDAGVLSAVTMAALKDWHSALFLASPFTRAPYAFSLCDLLDPQMARRLRITMAALSHTLENDTHGGDEVDSNGDTCAIDDVDIIEYTIDDDEHSSDSGRYLFAEEKGSKHPRDDQCNHHIDVTRSKRQMTSPTDGDNKDNNEKGVCDDHRLIKRLRHDDSALLNCRVTVDTKDAFERGLRDTFPHTADAVLRAIGPNAVLAGGCVVEAVQREAFRAHLPTSDIDVWVIGTNDQERRRSFRRIVSDLFDALPDYRATVSGSVVTFSPSPLRTSPPPTLPVTASPLDDQSTETVQVIYTDAQCGGDVIAQFDLSHTTAYYDGASVMALWDCAWSLVTRCTDTIDRRPVRLVRIDRAVLKGFDPLDECLANAVSDHSEMPASDNHTKEPRGDHWYTDAMSLLDDFTHRPIDARRYNEYCLAKRLPGPLLDEPIYLSMPLVCVAFGAECPKCRAHNVGTHNAPVRCQCIDAPSRRMRLDIPHRRGDYGRFHCTLSMIDRAATFARDIKACESSFAQHYRDTIESVIVSATASATPDASDALFISQDGRLHREFPDLLSLKCLAGTTTVVNALTKESMNPGDCVSMWATGRVAFHRIDLLPGALFAGLTAIELTVYPPGIATLVDGLDRTIAATK